MIPNDDIELLALEMIRRFSANATDQAAVRSTAFCHLGLTEKSKEWLLVRATIEKIWVEGRSGQVQGMCHV
jgi:hypothetical protein